MDSYTIVEDVIGILSEQLGTKLHFCLSTVSREESNGDLIKQAKVSYPIELPSNLGGNGFSGQGNMDVDQHKGVFKLKYRNDTATYKYDLQSFMANIEGEEVFFAILDTDVVETTNDNIFHSDSSVGLISDYTSRSMDIELFSNGEADIHISLRNENGKLVPELKKYSVAAILCGSSEECEME